VGVSRRGLARLPWRLRYDYGDRALSKLRALSVRVTHRHATVQIGAGAYFGPGFHLYIPDHGTLIIGDRVRFRRGFVCEISGEGRVEIGADSIFTSDTIIGCTTSITIGEHCSFGQATLIMDGFHRFRDPDRWMMEQGYEFRPITIGAGASVTAKCTISADIGERAMIGANSVVNRDIPAFTFAAGAPARVLDYFGPPERRPADLEEVRRR